MNNSRFFLYKCIRNPIWPWSKVGQPRFIICANLVGPTSPMLHTKFQRHWPFGSSEDILRVFTIYGHGGHLNHVTKKFWLPIIRSLPMKYEFNWPGGFWENYALIYWWDSNERYLLKGQRWPMILIYSHCLIRFRIMTLVAISFSKNFHQNTLGSKFHHDVISNSGPQIRVRNWKLFFLFLYQNICCGYSKEPSRWDGSFEHPKYMFKLMDKKIIAILRKLFLLNWPYVTRIIIRTNLVGPTSQLLHTKAFWFWIRISKGFYHIWAWPLSWSCDQDHLSKLPLPHPKESPYEIWVRLAQWFQEMFKTVDWRTPESLV